MIDRARNIIIKPFEPDDVSILEKWFYSGDYDDFFVNALTLTKEQLKVYSYMRDGQAFMIWKEGKAIGFISLYDMRAVAANLKLGIFIDKAHQENGDMFASMKMTANYIFMQMHFVKLIFEILVTNTRARYLAEKAGFKVEGIMIKEANCGGVFTDVVRYTMFKEDFMKAVEEGAYGQ